MITGDVGGWKAATDFHDLGKVANNRVEAQAENQHIKSHNQSSRPLAKNYSPLFVYLSVCLSLCEKSTFGIQAEIATQ